MIQFITEKTAKKDNDNDEKVLKPIEAIKEDENPISKTKQKKIEKNKKKK